MTDIDKLEQIPDAPTDPTQPLEDVGNVPTGRDRARWEQTPEPPEPAVVQRVADSAWGVMRERGIEPRFENESDGVLDPDGVFLAIGEHLVSRTNLPIDFQIGHEQTPEGGGR